MAEYGDQEEQEHVQIQKGSPSGRGLIHSHRKDNFALALWSF